MLNTKFFATKKATLFKFVQKRLLSENSEMEKKKIFTIDQ